MCSAYDSIVKNPFSTRRYVQFFHDSHKLVHRLEPLDLILEILNRIEFFLIFLTGLIGDHLELLHILYEIIVDDMADLFILRRIIHELLLVFLYHAPQVLHLCFYMPLFFRLNFILSIVFVWVTKF